MSEYRLHVGDCRALLAEMQPDMFDACITDPPYELAFMGKTWDKRGISFDPETWRAVYRVLKPGARLLAFGAPRTHHRIWCAIEDAGFVIEDTVMWLFGQGFPKHSSKLKPAHEPIAVARKGPVTALNIDAARIGDGKAERVGTAIRRTLSPSVAASGIGAVGAEQTWTKYGPDGGRWPANVALDERAAELLDEMSGVDLTGAWPARRSGIGYAGGSAGTNDGELRVAEPGGASRFFYTSKASRAERNHGLEGMAERTKRILNGGIPSAVNSDPRGMSGGGDRQAQNHHATVKPVDLMCWLVRLVTQPGDRVLDPFAGSGTTGVACMQEGRAFTGIEIDTDYAAIADRRIRAAPLSLFAGLPNSECGTAICVQRKTNGLLCNCEDGAA